MGMILNWLSVSARGLYSAVDEIKGKFNLPNSKVISVDIPANYGGRYWDVGFGLNVSIPGGGLVGNNLSVEWLQPVAQDVNGFQVEREGTIIANWSYAF